MSDSWDDFINDLIEEPLPPAVKSKTQTFPCPSCVGKGCRDCKGKGSFKTDPRKLAKNRARAKENRRKKGSPGKQANIALEGNLVMALTDISSWNSFASSLLDQHDAGRAWSEKQVLAIRQMLAKMESNQKAKAEAAPATNIDLTPIRKMFEKAFATGHKKPVYRAEGLIINRAPDSGANPGALYVKNELKEYGGKVIETTFSPSRDGRADDFTEHGNALEALKLIAGDPLEAAVRYGRKTGKCACCGRKLTAKKSVELGIGPICAETWGL